MLIETGVLSDSRRYYVTRSDFTHNYLYHVSHAGVYHCNADYEIHRPAGLDTFVLLLIDSGKLTIECQGETYVASTDAMILLSSQQPHRYYASSDDLRMRWFHFDGCSSKAYVDSIIQKQGFFLHHALGNPDIEACCSDIMLAAEHGISNPHTVSVTIHKLLALLINLSEERKKTEIEQTIDRSIAYIDEHYADSALTVDFLAKQSAFSVAYYIRKFKEFRDMTPHQYILSLRIQMAKHDLFTTSYSIEDISERCGFSSASHFIMAFRKATGMTPLHYRTVWL